MRSCHSFNLQERGNGFEPLDWRVGQPMPLHCINEARLRRAAPLKAESILIAECLNTEYRDTSSIRHTVNELARGCLAGADYTIEDTYVLYAGVGNMGGMNLKNQGGSS
ncbi:hypothetical protein LMTR13_24300 [Bradyrhizobium icense]|uniref:Uncharacterized protein n=1 Tax=Bradyrhizobium icense TaxID=1274631 RepID=A0A1B1UJ58_9BRAD|nr:hypothetical protein LMTR13_24300 [Bradyrhizobium icense]